MRILNCLNVRGLQLVSNKNKHLQIGDLLKERNSLGILLTETWLNSDTLDAELLIEGFTLFRGDREGRVRGGSAIYLLNELHSKLESAYSNSVVDYVIVKVKKL